MKRIVNFIFILITISCDRTETGEQNRVDTTTLIKTKVADQVDLKIDSISVTDSLLITFNKKIKIDTSVYKLFKDTTFEELHLFSPDHDKLKCKFTGEPIPGKYFKYFNGDDFELEYQKGGYKIFACYKFQISPNKTGLIIRVPGPYSETAIRFIIVNENKFIDSNFELCNSAGDGLWYYVRDAWIENNSVENLKIISRKREKWFKSRRINPDSIEFDTFPTDSLGIYTYLNPSFSLAKGLFTLDTIKYKLEHWN